MREEVEEEESVELVAMAATDAKEPLGPCGPDLLPVTPWQFGNSHVCSQSHWGTLEAPECREALNRVPSHTGVPWRPQRRGALCGADYGSRGRGEPGYGGVCMTELSGTGRSLDRGQAEPPAGPSEARLCV